MKKLWGLLLMVCALILPLAAQAASVADAVDISTYLVSRPQGFGAEQKAYTGDAQPALKVPGVLKPEYANNGYEIWWSIGYGWTTSPYYLPLGGELFSDEWVESFFPNKAAAPMSVAKCNGDPESFAYILVKDGHYVAGGPDDAIYFRPGMGTPYYTTAPEAKDLTYNGSAQQLVTAGVPKVGTVYYSVNGGSFSTSIPTGTDVGTYTVQHYIKVTDTYEKKTWNETSATETTTVTIKGIPSQLVKAPQNYAFGYYNGKAQDIIPSNAAGEARNGVMVYALTDANVTVAPADNAFTTTLPKATEAGEYKVWYKVRGNGDYADTEPAYLEWRMLYYSIEGRTFTLNPQSFTYDTTEHKPEVKISASLADGIVNLKEGTDFTVEYNDNVEAGTATVTVTGIGNYRGTTSKTFEIKPLDLAADADVTVNSKPAYNGNPHTPAPVVKIGNTVLDSSLYTVEWSNNVNAGTATVTVTAKEGSSLTGSATATFSIRKTTPTLIWDAPTEYTYTGEPITIPAPVVILVKDEIYTGGFQFDYKPLDSPDWVYADFPVNAGQYVITVTTDEMGNYKWNADVLTITINQAEPSFTKPEGLTMVFGQTVGDIELTDSHFSWVTPDDSPEHAGAWSAQMRYTPDDSLNYKSVVFDADITVQKAPVTPGVPVLAENLVYNSQMQPLVASAEAFTGGGFLYSLDGETWSDELPAAEKAGTYTVWYMIKCGNDYYHADEGVPVEIGEVTIAKCPVTLTSNGTVQKAYDGTTDLPGWDYAYSFTLQAMEGDDLSWTASGAYDTPDVGFNKTVTLTDIKLSGTDADNYVLTSTEFSGSIGIIIQRFVNRIYGPEDTTLTRYYADSAQAATELPAEVVCADAYIWTLQISWSCEDYDPTPGATNTFSWRITDPLSANDDLSGHRTSGQINVTNADALPVVVSGQNMETVYNGAAVDVSVMFTLDPNAGSATYTMTPVDGEGTLTNGMLTVTKAGSFTVTAKTEASGAYAAGEATATLTVKRGTMNLEETILQAICGWKLSQVQLPSHPEGEWSWEDPETVTDAWGAQRTYPAIFTPNDLGLWQEQAVNMTVNTMPATAEFTRVEADRESYTYGDTVTVTVEMTHNGNGDVTGEVALFYGDIQLTDPVELVDGAAVLTYDTAQKGLNIGESGLTVQYLGTPAIQEAGAPLTITLHRKPLTVASLETKDRMYSEGLKTVEITGATLSGVIGSDEVKLLAGQVATLSGDAVGEYNEVTLPEGLRLVGEDSNYYEVAGGVKVPAKTTVTEAPDNLLTKIVYEVFALKDLSDVFVEMGIANPAMLQRELESMLPFDMDGSVLYDVTIMISLDGGETWQKGGAEHLPAGGKVLVKLPIPEGTSPQSHSYYAAHAFTDASFGRQPGAVETPAVKVIRRNGEYYLTVELNGLSPLLIGWSEGSMDIPQTGDPTNPALWLSLLLFSMTAIALLRRKATAGK